MLEVVLGWLGVCLASDVIAVFWLQRYFDAAGLLRGCWGAVRFLTAGELFHNN
jgi:hypothetical protein